MDYWFSAADRITAVDEHWMAFARENGAEALVPEEVCGRHLSSFISDATTHALWESLLKRSRQGHRIKLPIRCDAPDRRRSLSLTVSTEGPLTCVRSTLVSEETRPPVRLLESGHTTSGDPLTSCSWCNRLRLGPDIWVEVEVLVRTLDLFSRPSLPAISHSICPACFERVSAQLRA